MEEMYLPFIGSLSQDTWPWRGIGGAHRGIACGLRILRGHGCGWIIGRGITLPHHCQGRDRDRSGCGRGRGQRAQTVRGGGGACRGFWDSCRRCEREVPGQCLLGPDRLHRNHNRLCLIKSHRCPWGPRIRVCCLQGGC